MKISELLCETQLFENNKRTVVFTFGRMNPPHWGYSALIHRLRHEAKIKKADWVIFLSSKQEPKKNPLSHSEKISWLTKLFPQVEGHVVEDSDIKTLLQAAAWLYSQGYRSAVFVAGEDDIESYSKVIRNGNHHGKNNPELLSQGRAFYFDPLEFAVAKRLAKATDARTAAQDADNSQFVQAILGPYAPRTDAQLVDAIADELYNSVRHGMALSTSGTHMKINELYEKAQVWDKPSGRKKSKKLTPAQKSAAKARAKRAGRPYPNLIDNMWASRR